jgi:CubicO group peptidase (beta-lactamase class C family)
MADYDIPGVGLAIVQNGKVVYVKGYGVRDVTTGAPVTADTQFSIASLTKSFTSLGVMLLVQQGKVRLDDPVTKYLPEFKLSEPGATARVTVRNLLSHTTGLARNDAIALDPTLTRGDVLKMIATQPLQSQPGERFAYSNLNTTAAGVLIERISGQTWEDYTRDKILAPLGMHTATLSVEAMQASPNFARPHQIDVLKGNEPIAFLSVPSGAPAGAVNASAAEMARYVQFQLGDGTFDGQRLLSPELMAEMHRTQIVVPGLNQGANAAMAASAQGRPAPDNLIADTGYAFYWITEKFEGHPIVWHDGATPGFSPLMMLIPETHSGVVILTNAHFMQPFDQVLRQHLAEVLLGIVPQHDVQQIFEAQAKVLGTDNATRRAQLAAARSYKANPSDFEALVGEYASLTGDKPSRVSVVGGKLMLDLSLQGVTAKTELIPYSQRGFIGNDGFAKGWPVTFVQGQDGKITLTIQGIRVAER